METYILNQRIKAISHEISLCKRSLSSKCVERLQAIKNRLKQWINDLVIEHKNKLKAARQAAAEKKAIDSQLIEEPKY